MPRITLLLFLLLFTPLTYGQLEPVAQEKGANGLALALRKLGNFHTVLQVTAHPDDEDNGLLVYLSRTLGARTALLTLTRGEGGQNEIGSEQGEAMGILRTEELAAMHRLDGAEQYFGYAYEFGYSFSVEETFEKWGKDETLEDIVRVIRALKPDVLLCMTPRGLGGGQHHQASGILSLEAFRAAADPARFPHLEEEGLQPWQPYKIYSRAWGRRSIPQDQSGEMIRLETGKFDPLLGMSPFQLGVMARSNHLCQSMNRVIPPPGDVFSSIYVLEDSVTDAAPQQDSLFGGVPDRLTGYLPEEEREQFGFIDPSEDEYRKLIEHARSQFDINKPWAIADTLVEARSVIEQLLAKMDNRASGIIPQLTCELDELDEAIRLAYGIEARADADRSETVRGGSLEVSLTIANHSPAALTLTGGCGFPAGWDTSGDLPGKIDGDSVVESDIKIQLPQSQPVSKPYWMLENNRNRYTLLDKPKTPGRPFMEPPVVTLDFSAGSPERRFSVEVPVLYRYLNPYGVGGKQKELTVLPKITLNVEPELLVFPIRSTVPPKTASVRYTNHSDGEKTVEARLDAPAGWRVEPSSETFTLKRKDESHTVRFTLQPPDELRAGEYAVCAVAVSDGEEFREGFRTIEYPHTQKRYYFQPSTIKTVADAIAVAPVKVGYIMGAGDLVADAIAQLGLDVTLLDDSTIRDGDLSQYDVIVTGIRAYLKNDALRDYNHRLLEYAENGGTVIVQYNKYELNDQPFLPYPANVSHDRVTDENAPVRILAPGHPAFNSPNRIVDSDWEGWVQERGIYFLGRKDERYVDLLASTESFAYNSGEKQGILVEAKVGGGRWIYCALAMFRQLPAGVPGAYKLFANLLSLPITVVD